MNTAITYHQFIYGKNSSKDSHYIEFPQEEHLREFIVKGSYSIVDGMFTRERIQGKWYYIMAKLGKVAGVGEDGRIAAYRNILMIQENELKKVFFLNPFLFQNSITDNSPFDIFIPKEDLLESNAKQLLFNTENIRDNVPAILDADYRNLLFDLFSGTLDTENLELIQGMLLRLPVKIRRFVVIKSPNFNQPYANVQLNCVVDFMLEGPGAHPDYFKLVIKNLEENDFDLFANRLYYEARMYEILIDSGNIDSEKDSPLFDYLYNFNDFSPDLRFRNLLFSLFHLKDCTQIQDAFNNWTNFDYDTFIYPSFMHAMFKDKISDIVIEEKWIDPVLRLSPLRTIQYDNEAKLNLLEIISSNYVRNATSLRGITFELLHDIIPPVSIEDFKERFLRMPHEDRKKGVEFMTNGLRKLGANDLQIFNLYLDTLDREDPDLEKTLRFAEGNFRDLKLVKPSLLGYVTEALEESIPLNETKDYDLEELGILLKSFRENIFPILPRMESDFLKLIRKRVADIGMDSASYREPDITTKKLNYAEVLQENYHMFQIKNLQK